MEEVHEDYILGTGSAVGGIREEYCAGKPKKQNQKRGYGCCDRWTGPGEEWEGPLD